MFFRTSFLIPIISMLIFLSFPCVSQPKTHADMTNLNFDFEDILVKDLLKLIKKRVGIQIQIDKYYHEKRITIKASNSSLDKVVATILRRLDVRNFATVLNYENQTLIVYLFQRDKWGEIQEDSLEDEFLPPKEPGGKGLSLAEYQSLQESRERVQTPGDKMDEPLFPPNPDDPDGKPMTLREYKALQEYRERVQTPGDKMDEPVFSPHYENNETKGLTLPEYNALKRPYETQASQNLE